MAVQTEAQKKFVEDLKERLVDAGKKNVAIEAETLEENQKKAMENIAEAFSEPVKEFIDSETSQVANISIVSYDKSVEVMPGKDPVTGKEFTNLSVNKTINNAIAAHNVDPEAHADIRQCIEDSVLKISVGPDGSNEMTFYRGELL